MLVNPLPSSAAVTFAAAPYGGRSLAAPGPTTGQNSQFNPAQAPQTAAKAQLLVARDAGQSGDDLARRPASGVESENTAGGTTAVTEASDDDRIAAEREKQQLLKDQREITGLAARDREVRAHEQAHAAVGGQYAGAPSYQYQRGPDGVNYAVSGEVPIDVGREATPQQTLLKAQIVRRAALAPAEPSPQDRKVAAQASRLEAEARADLRAEQIESSQAQEGNAEQSEVNADRPESSADSATGAARGEGTTVRNSSAVAEPSQVIGRSASKALAFSADRVNAPGALLDQMA